MRCLECEENEERWKPIPMLRCHYEVSSRGRIRNSVTLHILKPFDGYGKHGKHYKKVCLYIEGRRHCQFVHRLVAFAFYEVDHADRNRGHNGLHNLEPTLRKENDKRWREKDKVPF